MDTYQPPTVWTLSRSIYIRGFQLIESMGYAPRRRKTMEHRVVIMNYSDDEIQMDLNMSAIPRIGDCIRDNDRGTI